MPHGKLESVLSKCLSSDWIWLLLYNLFARPARVLQRQRCKAVQEKIKRANTQAGVIDGPFKGLKYPHLEAFGSALWPKLAGTYESELHPVLDEIVTRQYGRIVDVGCAEGYYAVGLAKCFPGVPINAYDVDAKARDLCQQMATCNDVEDRITVGALCAPEDLTALDYGGRGLIICDCEGCERNLFTPSNAKALSTCDLLIEVHPHVHADIQAFLSELFSTTHQVKVIEQRNDDEKAEHYRLTGIHEPSYEIRKHLLSECRSPGTGWMFFSAKTRPADSDKKTPD